jgi:hypothetical protein
MILGLRSLFAAAAAMTLVAVGGLEALLLAMNAGDGSGRLFVVRLGRRRLSRDLRQSMR